jgi:hypothetical protein
MVRRVYDAPPAPPVPQRQASAPAGLEQTLAERGSRYGNFTERAQICQRLKMAMTDCPGWSRLADYQKQALEVVADKIARILNGDPDYLDNWHDIQGYARLVEKRLQEVANGTDQ